MKLHEKKLWCMKKKNLSKIEIIDKWLEIVDNAMVKDSLLFYKTRLLERVPLYNANKMNADDLEHATVVYDYLSRNDEPKVYKLFRIHWS